MRTFPPPLPVTLFSVTLLSGFHLLGEELTQSHSFNCHKQLQVKSEAELRSVQNTLNLLNQSLSPTFSRKLLNETEFGGFVTGSSRMNQHVWLQGALFYQVSLNQINSVFDFCRTSTYLTVISAPPAGGGGAWEAPGPGPRSGRSREEQHDAGPDPRATGGQEGALPAHSRLQLHEPQCPRLSAGLPGE